MERITYKQIKKICKEISKKIPYEAKCRKKGNNIIFNINPKQNNFLK